jgi:branched-chain amino acid transport system permease protein
MNKTFSGILAAGALLAVVPWLGLPAFYESFLYLIAHWVILAMSWNILSGYSGYFSFGHGVFYGVGMYATAGLAGKLDWPFLATLPMAVLIPAVLGVLLGAVVFRVKAVRGELFALLTLAVTFVVATIIINTRIDGGPGVYLMSVAVPKFGPSASSSLYLMALTGAVLTALIAYKVQQSKLGVGLSAIHDDEDVAEVMGVPTYGYKLLALALSSGLAGLAGGIHALFVQYVTVGETFNITVPLTVVLMSCLGGSRHWAGPAVGAVLITSMLYFFTAGNNPVLGKALVGVVLIVVILFMPNGVMGYFMKRRAQAAARRSREIEQSLGSVVHAGLPPRRPRRLLRRCRPPSPAVKLCWRRAVCPRPSKACRPSVKSICRSTRARSWVCWARTVLASRPSSMWSAVTMRPRAGPMPSKGVSWWARRPTRWRSLALPAPIKSRAPS